MPVRFWRGGTSKLWWATTITPAAPAAASLTVDLTASTDDLMGFAARRDSREVRVWGQQAVVQRLGALMVDEPTLVLAEYSDANPLRVTLAAGASGNLVFFPVGYAGGSPAPGDLVDVMPVASKGPERDIDREAVATWRVSFAPSGAPAFDAVLV